MAFPIGNLEVAMPLKRRRNLSPAPPAECPLAICLSWLGGAWTPNVIWYLRGGPRRFSELKADLPGISAKVLTTRLRELERLGVVTRAVMPTSPPSVEYRLTELGDRLVPALEAIVMVGNDLRTRAAAGMAARPRHLRAV
jgi:DNA-binding HxlR family transcriptional regulator